MKRRSFVRLLKRFKATWRFRAWASLTRSRAWCCSSPPTRPASRPAPSSSPTAAFCSAQCRTPARKGQMADHEVLIQQLNRHHATKQFEPAERTLNDGIVDPEFRCESVPIPGVRDDSQAGNYQSCHAHREISEEFWMQLSRISTVACTFRITIQIQLVAQLRK